VFYLTGQPISELQAGQRAPLAGQSTVSIVLSPARRAVLHQRIEARFHAMMADGFLAEVRALRARGDLDAHTPSMRAVGYRQLWAHLDGAYGLEEGVRRGIVATRRLAKRQLTWLRALPGTHWVEPTDNSAVDFIAGLVKSL
jgi:tRNA dimethylallyltransferase